MISSAPTSIPARIREDRRSRRTFTVGAVVTVGGNLLLLATLIGSVPVVPITTTDPEALTVVPIIVATVLAMLGAAGIAVAVQRATQRPAHHLHPTG